MSLDLLPTEKVEPCVTPTASVIWMHGLGADGHDFVPKREPGMYGELFYVCCICGYEKL